MGDKRQKSKFVLDESIFSAIKTAVDAGYKQGYERGKQDKAVEIFNNCTTVGIPLETAKSVSGHSEYTCREKEEHYAEGVKYSAAAQTFVYIENLLVNSCLAGQGVGHA